MSSGIEIRPLVSADEPQWRRLWSLYLEFYNTEVSEKVYQATFSRLLSADEHEYNCLMAVNNGKPVGLAHFLTHRHCWRVENVVYLQDLFVDASERGHGAGLALIKAVYEYADRQETPFVYWLTQPESQAAKLLYDRLAQKTEFVKYHR